MPLDPDALLRVHTTIRACFKKPSQLKSSNKIYQLDEKGALSSHAARRNANSEPAWAQISQLRKTNVKITNIADKGFHVLNQKNLAGNCVEMAEAAAYLVMRERLGAAFLGGIVSQDPVYRIDHAFCMVTEGPITRTQVLNALAQESAAAWAIDPWANVCCPVRSYEKNLCDKLGRWSAQGKRIQVVSKALGTLVTLDPAAHNYRQGLCSGVLKYFAAELVSAGRLPRALLAEAKQGRQQCVIL